MQQYKTCKACKANLPLESFGLDSTRAGGRKSQCRECRGKGNAPNTPEAVKGLIAFASGEHATAAEALVQHGSVRAAAEALGWAPRRLRQCLGELARQAARRGWAPHHDMTHVVPEGFYIKGTSTLYDREGQIAGQWVKSQRDPEHRIELLLDAVQRIAEPFRGAAEPTQAKANRSDDLLCVYPFGDPHFGMHAWADETGENFDLKIAERDLITAVDHLVSLAPPARTGMLVSLGDLFHADSKKASTTAGTPVDVDSRWGKVLEVVVRTMRRCIDRMLEVHEQVKVISASGNHDELSALVLAVCLSLYYEREPRVQVETSPAKFYWHRFGKNLIGVHHGDTAKASDLPGVMACDRAKDWGETDHRYFYCGHIHHERVQEYPGVVVESFRTLAPKDAWHSAQGYRSGRDLRLDVLHREWGRVNRHIVGIQQIRSLQR